MSLLIGPAWAQSPLYAEDSALLPTLIAPTRLNEREWVPVVLMNSQQGPVFATDGVLLGFLQVNSVSDEWQGNSRQRVQVQGKVPVMDRLSLKGLIAGSDFKPCLGLIEQSELAPLRPDLCDGLASASTSSSTAVALGAQLDLAKGWIGVSVTNAEGLDLGLAGPAFSNPVLPQAFSAPKPGPLAQVSPLVRNPQTQALGMQAMLELDDEARLGIGLALARAQLHGGGTPTVVDQGSLTFSLEQGNLGAILGTRVIDLPGLKEFLPWAGLDLGVSWRLPWQGVISVGAQNLISRGDAPPKGLDHALDEGAEAFERIPYVRYHQDL
ncbi:MAG: hypothetical protein KDI56_03180 [Xanthomonadales bacterium]|nr:hypothetical protein [Xanthomonadales bacterium]